MKRLQIPQKLVYEKFYVHEKILHTQNCRHEFIKKLLLEKRKENMQTKQPRFKSRLKKAGYCFIVDFDIVANGHAFTNVCNFIDLNSWCFLSWF